ncbi:MAG: hypothetical protein QNJ20_17740 [Paracoccaceae bacterium]|nr:hypothetical protein [Paracoccaceae bacterium]
MGNLLCMWLFLDFAFGPTPGVFNRANDCLAAIVNMNMFHGDLLLAFATMLVQRVE